MNQKYTRKLRLSDLHMLSVFGLLCLSLIWGLTFPLIKNAIIHRDALGFVSDRFLLAFVVTFFCLLYKARFNIKKFKTIFSEDSLKMGSVLGFVLFLGFGFQTAGLKYTSAPSAAFITGLSVVFVPIAEMIFKRTWLKLNNLIACLLGFVGLALLTLTTDAQEHFNVNRGDVLELLCAVAFTFQIILVSKISKKTSLLSIMCVEFFVCFVFTALYGVFIEEVAFMPSALLFQNLQYSAAMIFCGIFATFFALLGQAFFQRQVTPSQSALILSAEPVFAAIFSVLLFADVMRERQIFGALLMLVGIIISEIPLSFKNKTSKVG